MAKGHEDDVVVELDGTDIELLLAQAMIADDARKRADKAFEDVADSIRKLLGDATVGTVGGVEIVTNRWQQRAVPDLKKLKEEHPSVYEAIVGHSRYRKLDRKVKRKRK